MQDDDVEDDYVQYHGLGYKGLKDLKVLTTMDIPSQERASNVSALHSILPLICQQLINKDFPPELVDYVVSFMSLGMTREMAENHRRALMRDKKIELNHPIAVRLSYSTENNACLIYCGSFTKQVGHSVNTKCDIYIDFMLYFSPTNIDDWTHTSPRFGPICSRLLLLFFGPLDKFPLVTDIATGRKTQRALPAVGDGKTPFHYCSLSSRYHSTVPRPEYRDNS